MLRLQGLSELALWECWVRSVRSLRKLDFDFGFGVTCLRHKHTRIELPSRRQGTFLNSDGFLGS